MLSSLKSQFLENQPVNICIERAFSCSCNIPESFSLTCFFALFNFSLVSLGKINNRTTKQSTAKKSSFTTNWHNYTIIKLLSGPLTDIPSTVRAINLTPGALWCVLGDLPDNELPTDGATEVARQVLEKSPTKKVPPSKPHPLADEEDDDGHRSSWRWWSPTWGTGWAICTPYPCSRCRYRSQHRPRPSAVYSSRISFSKRVYGYITLINHQSLSNIKHNGNAHSNRNRSLPVYSWCTALPATYFTMAPLYPSKLSTKYSCYLHPHQNQKSDGPSSDINILCRLFPG